MVDFTEMGEMVRTMLAPLEQRVAMLENAMALLSRHVGYSDSDHPEELEEWDHPHEEGK